MKIHPDTIQTLSVQACGPDWIEVQGTRISHSVILSSRGEMIDWQCPQFEHLTEQHFRQLADLQTEVVIFGSGPRQRFVHPALTCALIERQIGLETMSTAAACRTYNILAGEGRLVAVALLMQ